MTILPSFSFASGNPDNLVGGSPASMGDVQGPLYDLRDYINTALKPIIDSMQSGGFVTGDLKPTAATSAPPGWLLCQGQLLDRTTYADLFAVIGTAYGVGDGSTTFGLPDLQGRVPVGADSAGAHMPNQHPVLGAAGGEERHTLLVAELAEHTHQYVDLQPYNGGSVWGQSSAGVPPGGISYGTQSQIVTSQGINNASKNQPHQNMPPYQAVNWTIKT